MTAIGENLGGLLTRKMHCSNGSVEIVYKEKERGFPLLNANKHIYIKYIYIIYLFETIVSTVWPSSLVFY